jgi:hypothetical protein
LWHKWERIEPNCGTAGEKGSAKESIVLEKMHVIEFPKQRNGTLI